MEKQKKSQKAMVTLDKRNLLKVIRAQAKFAARYEAHNMLNCINIAVDADEIIFASTDGNRLLESKIGIVNDGDLKSCVLNIPAWLLTGICFNVSQGDYIELVMDNNQLEINDFANDYSLCLKSWFKEAKFPNYKEFFPQDFKQNHEIAINQRFIDDITSLIPNERTGIIRLSLDAQDALRPIVLNADNPEIKQRALVMPVQIRK